MIVQNVRTVRLGGVLFVVAAVQYLVLEAIAASAWHNPPYNYAVDFISDLGNPVPGEVFTGRLIDSPLNLVMDAAFIAQGVLFIIGAMFLMRLIGGRLSGVLLVLAVLHGVGVILVGFFHESVAALSNGVIIVHSIGAASTIVAGNVIAIIVGIAGRRASARGWYRVASVVLGVVGLAAFVVLQTDHELYVAAGGIPERIAVYTIIAWEAITGIAVLIRSRTAPTSSLERTGA